MSRGFLLAVFVMAIASAFTRSGAQTSAVPAAQAPVVGRSATLTNEVLERTISLRLEHVTLEQALQAVGRAAGLTITYSVDAIPAAKHVSLVSDQISVRDALSVLLHGTDVEPIAFSRQEIMLKRMVGGDVVAGVANPQQGTGTISGYVRDSATGTSIPQATVRVDGTALETNSGTEGQYRLTGIAAGDYRVTARRVGYLAQTRTITLGDGGTKTLNFQLNPPATKLDEVVTTAVGELRRYQVGNLISTINVDSLAPTTPVTSVTDILSARVPGVEVMENSGVVGSGETIRIRGVSSLVLQGDPVVIVDGIPTDNAPGGYVETGYSAGLHPTPTRMNDLNFDDIETISVLKGPAATTEYGTDAANGVIVITTKHGSAGAPLWHADAEQGATRLPQAYPAKYYAWGHLTDGTGDASGSGSGFGTAIGPCTLNPPLGGSYAAYGPSLGVSVTRGNCVVDSITQFNPLNNANTTLFGTGGNQKYDVSVSGGSDALRYYISGGMSNETGMLRLPSVFRMLADTAGVILPSAAYNPNVEQQRSVRLNTQTRLNAATDLSVNVNYLSTFVQTPDVQELLNAAQSSGGIDDATNLYGYASFGGTALGGSPQNSPFQELSSIGFDNTTRVEGSATVNWRPTPWLVGHAILGVDHGSDQQGATQYPIGNNAYFNTGGTSLSLGTNIIDNYTVDLRATATAALTNTVRAVTSTGLQMVSSRSTGQTGSVDNITLANLTLDGYPGALIDETTNDAVTLGGYGEEQVGIADRLFLIGAVRVDGASGFGNAYAVAVYPKASASWQAFNNGKTTVRLRGAFGESGVQPANGASELLYSAGLAYVGAAAVSDETVSWPGNPNLRPERSEEYEGGVDVSGWANRITFELTAYQKVTHDALVDVNLGGDACCYVYQENVGEVANDGMEAAATIGVLQTRRVTWDIAVNASMNRNKLITLAPGAQAALGSVGESGFEELKVGYPLYGLFGYPVAYADATHDGIIESSEVSVGDSLAYAGPSTPTREMSIATHVGLWHGTLALGGLVDYQGGYKIYNGIASDLDAAGATPGANLPTAPLWQQARAASPLAANGDPVTLYLEDGTFIRFRELALTYAVPRGVVHRFGVVDNLSITAAVRNLALWTRYSGIDPEVSNAAYNSGNVTNQSPGAATLNNNIREDQGAVPLTRDLVVRLNVGLR